MEPKELESWLHSSVGQSNGNGPPPEVWHDYERLTTQLAECRRLLREAVDRIESQGGYYAGWWTEWLQSARKAAGGGE